ncbi:uncharacterized protein EV420DRAFT_1487106 [Desarmillaria tabescens]|uniref:Uncharacterized protein n=1 Tax=Armillaria tabescens TaxID=1929756 RepID=A0AA39J831_ARMTA|nr:uncharacterized protein EV420DRAFT_1487106 [Desarmillaria tabescens]KAK0437429.1 hypothetical protein EV420DRAFT_1487106 [Desarmillaria tabescens]
MTITCERTQTHARKCPQFAGVNAGMLVATGPNNLVIMDKGGMYRVTSTWKNSGDRSSGSPYSSFRYMPDIMGCKITVTASGGVTHWVLMPDDEHNLPFHSRPNFDANFWTSELGLGPSKLKSATKPIKHQLLSGLDMLSVMSGQNTTLFLVWPSDKMSQSERHLRQEDEEED